MIWRLALIYLNFDPMGISRAGKLKMKHKKNNVLSSLCPMDENPGRYEQVFNVHLKFSLKGLVLGKEPFKYYVIKAHASKRWVGGVRKWLFLMIYSTVNF